ncbi:GNAT family N-acetyltransferase [Campylobacter upsaliensis]|uniref:Predicted amino-acid acetyltransferase complementing ArgA function in Arginine Biosynthesis pathway n=1 Tax=Campylobacter upsaliensis TaxID=28080 RepID=A0A448KQF8_CAMUP|nr:N-acetyltransferase [Campylobacter upsaliensis]EAH5675966.1 N-acetyltransferase [Campylobacter upsaliensis]EAH6025369.1 N-acetyltransferase [Campylobacter upsaliensis]EAH6029009.1 N-acetyltransferase [Campylobacter upsaliensis]EAH6236548.1 N-acetyltransferase [Campylobacter upsaliensis]EAH8337040.1 N-acetyltransferase [Campylobacter upsaliensis]
MKIRAMQEEDYEKVYALWCEIKGFGLRSIDDSFENISAFLGRNPNLSAVAELEGEIIGSILCGHDGRTGGFYHVCVHKNHRKKGIAHEMTKFCLEALKKEKINKIALIAFKSNDLGNEFWRHYGFTLREDANYYDLSLNDDNQTNFNR